MRSLVAALAACAFAATAAANECPGNPGAIGTSRTIVVDPGEYSRIGTMQYAHTLPLADREVVLTFDDGPIPPYTNRVLDTLAAECIKATFFIVGRQARAFPHLVRRVHEDGHTVANHSQNHPRFFDRLAAAKMQEEIEEGFAASAAALGNPAAVARFFRVPGLRTSGAIEAYVASQNAMVWSADFPADDWRGISAAQVKQRALDRLEAKGKGVLLLHDIQPATVLALPELLKELKARGYRIVHVTTAAPDRPKTVTAPEQWMLRGGSKGGWPRLAETRPQLAAPSPESFGWLDVFVTKEPVAIWPMQIKLEPRTDHEALRSAEPVWLAAGVAGLAVPADAAAPARRARRASACPTHPGRTSPYPPRAARPARTTATHSAVRLLTDFRLTRTGAVERTRSAES
jgi:peptidoglycan/xylan/chitin deacetylase (PgdA/CDA1 family)